MNFKNKLFALICVLLALISCEKTEEYVELNKPINKPIIEEVPIILDVKTDGIEGVMLSSDSCSLWILTNPKITKENKPIKIGDKKFVF